MQKVIELNQLENQNIQIVVLLQNYRMKDNRWVEYPVNIHQ